ncbi:hypothetical protein FQA47_017664 [Oryzias melastigma]|uniref:Uncharacterized protein n=1 Tax=Oryzias melastigma TaxID=30732 RepID=A0A834FRD0_ORYME|nr:hypothetical protein FQA47_017664 [Oryzias melastigma]
MSAACRFCLAQERAEVGTWEGWTEVIVPSLALCNLIFTEAGLCGAESSVWRPDGVTLDGMIEAEGGPSSSSSSVSRQQQRQQQQQLVRRRRAPGADCGLRQSPVPSGDAAL